MARTYIPIFFSARRLLSRLDDAQRGRVIAGLLEYAETNREPAELTQQELIAFESLRVSVDLDADRYEKKCAARSACGALGGRPKGSKKSKSFLNNPTSTPTSTSTPTPTPTPTSSSSPVPPAGETAAPEGAPTTTTTASDPVLDFWAKNFGRVNGYLRRQVAEARAKGLADDLLLLAMERALQYNAPNWAYVRRVLQDALALGAHSAAAYTAGSKPPRPGAAPGKPQAAPPGSMKARSGESQTPMKDMFHRDWNNAFLDAG